ncbi:MAG: guanine deaminase [Chloroflexi bacterium]|nr:guanine deaminase [Chloroflexota bacterium]
MSQLGLRGRLYTLIDDPFLQAESDCVVQHEDGLIIIRDDKIEAVGDYASLRGRLSPDAELRQYPDALLLPGFIDAHIHYAQVEIIGSFGTQLLEWLQKYTFPAEAKFSDPAHARRIADFFVAELLRHGTTSVSAFCTTAPGSVDAIFAAAQRVNMQILAGKMMMDRHAPANLLDTAQASYDESKALIERWHGRGRCLYTVTPRFALTSSREQLELAGALLRETSDLRLQSHISENRAEVARAKELFPERASYTDIYDHYGLLGARAIYGHGIHLGEGELRRFHETGAKIAHCPTSNFFIGSGLFDMARVRDAARPVTVGLGTDVGGGTSFSMLQTMSAAYQMAQLRGTSLTTAQCYYLATLGSAESLGLAGEVGSLQAGCAADVIALDPQATPLLRLRADVADSLDELLFALLICADDRAVAATYVAGRLVYERDEPTLISPKTT